MSPAIAGHTFQHNIPAFLANNLPLFYQMSFFSGRFVRKLFIEFTFFLHFPDKNTATLHPKSRLLENRRPKRGISFVYKGIHYPCDLQIPDKRLPFTFGLIPHEPALSGMR